MLTNKETTSIFDSLSAYVQYTAVLAYLIKVHQLIFTLSLHINLKPQMFMFSESFLTFVEDRSQKHKNI